MSKEVPVGVIDRTRAVIERICDCAHGARDRAHSTYARVSHVALASSLSLLRCGNIERLRAIEHTRAALEHTWYDQVH
jgi:hypothetical protein